MTEYLEADHWRDVEWDSNRWPNFSPQELACRGTGKFKIHIPTLDKLQQLRRRIGKPIIITSAYRSPEHNRAVGGASRSQHMEGRAFDVMMTNQQPAMFEAAARAEGFTSFGYYQHRDFMHIDTRAIPATWGTPWPAATSTYTPEPPQRPITQSTSGRTARDSAGVAGGLSLPQIVDQAQQVGYIANNPMFERFAAAAPWIGFAIALGFAGMIAWRLWKKWKREQEQ